VIGALVLTQAQIAVNGGHGIAGMITDKQDWPLALRAQDQGHHRLEAFKVGAISLGRLCVGTVHVLHME
jgi:hypothetical protein